MICMHEKASLQKETTEKELQICMTRVPADGTGLSEVCALCIQ
jgi:hypothetical protein